MGANEAIIDVEGDEIVPASHKLRLSGTVDIAKAVFPEPGAEVEIVIKGTVEGLAFDHKGPEKAKEWVRTAVVTGTKLIDISAKAPDPEQPRLDDGQPIGETVKDITDKMAEKREGKGSK